MTESITPRKETITFRLLKPWQLSQMHTKSNLVQWNNIFNTVGSLSSLHVPNDRAAIQYAIYADISRTYWLWYNVAFAPKKSKAIDSTKI